MQLLFPTERRSPKKRSTLDRSLLPSRKQNADLDRAVECVMGLRLLLASVTLGVGLLVAAQFLRGLPSPQPETPSAGIPQLDGSILGKTNALAELRSGGETGSIPPLAKDIWITEVAPSAVAVKPAVSSGATSRLTTLKPADENAGRAMTRDIQVELVRLGCYRGQVDGRWSPAVQNALVEFTTRLNTRLPIDGPDYAVLTLARNHAQPVCGPAAMPVQQDAALAPGEADALPGRMSLGATAPEGPPKPAAPRRTSRQVESLFMHPLGRY
jgi:hypothetical protein